MKDNFVVIDEIFTANLKKFQNMRSTDVYNVIAPYLDVSSCEDAKGLLLYIEELQTTGGYLLSTIKKKEAK